ncbi:MAG: di-heme oxidoredictase family protein [Trueperaceae bacterium]
MKDMLDLHADCATCIWHGLLESISEEDILALADPDDENGDGIRGNPNWLPQTNGSLRLGRFGLKANNPDLLEQNAGAFEGDIGVGNPIKADHTGAKDDISLEFLQNVTAYTQMLAVPARHNIYDANVRRGQETFMIMNCQSCHTPSFTTGDKHPTEALRDKTIYPFTDLLLHNMEPELADNRPEFSASGQDWRLWGIGLVKTVLSDEAYLHNGRARTLEEAILWHGGEAETAKETFRNVDLA